MRHLLFILTLTASGCGSMSWLSWQRARPDACDGSTCAEAPLSAADSVNLDPAPFIEYPMIEGPEVPSTLPNFETISPGESIPAPTPDPST